MTPALPCTNSDGHSFGEPWKCVVPTTLGRECVHCGKVRFVNADGEVHWLVCGENGRHNILSYGWPGSIEGGNATERGYIEADSAAGMPSDLDSQPRERNGEAVRQVAPVTSPSEIGGPPQFVRVCHRCVRYAAARNGFCAACVERPAPLPRPYYGTNVDPFGGAA